MLNPPAKLLNSRWICALSISRLASCKWNREAPSFYNFPQFITCLQKNCDPMWSFSTRNRNWRVYSSIHGSPSEYVCCSKECSLLKQLDTYRCSCFLRVFLLAFPRAPTTNGIMIDFTFHCASDSLATNGAIEMCFDWLIDWFITSLVPSPICPFLLLVICSGIPWYGVRLRNDMYCIGRGVKLYSLTHPGTVIDLSRALSVCPCNVWSAVFNHVDRLYAYIQEDFHILCHYDWFSPVLVPFLWTLYVILIAETPEDSSCDFIVPLLIFKLCQFAVFTWSFLCLCKFCNDKILLIILLFITKQD